MQEPACTEISLQQRKMNVCCDDDWCPDSLLILFSTAVTWAKEYSNDHKTASSFDKRLIAAPCSRHAMINMLFYALGEE
jgi:hypothetical protein